MKLQHIKEWYSSEQCAKQNEKCIDGYTRHKIYMPAYSDKIMTIIKINEET